MGYCATCAAAPSFARADGIEPAGDRQAVRAVVASLAAIAALCGEAAVDSEEQRTLRDGFDERATTGEALDGS
jgi:hypothetical protein